MKFYNYSREEPINHITELYREYLQSSEIEADPFLSKICLYHAFCLEVFPDELNKKILEIMHSAGEKTLSLTNRLYLREANDHFNKAGYSINIKFVENPVDNVEIEEGLDRLLGLLWAEGNGWGREENQEKITEAVKQQIDISKEIKTSALLETLLFLLTENKLEGFNQSIEYCLGRFLRRFEATGKIHEEYSEDFQKGIGSFSDIQNYILVSANLLKHNSSRADLKTLNAVLKLNDLLEILIDEIKNPTNFPLLVYSFAAEEREIKRLYDSKGFRLSAG